MPLRATLLTFALAAWGTTQAPPPNTAPPESRPEPASTAISAEQDPARPRSTLDATTTEALGRLATVLAQKRRDRVPLAVRPDDPALLALDAEVQRLELQFASLASQLEVVDFEKPSARQFDLQQELEQLIRPLLMALKDATAGPRQIADLQGRIDQLQQRQRVAETALRAVERTRDLLPAGSDARAEAERELARRWRPTVDQLRDEILVLRANLVQKESGQKSVWTSVTTTVRTFVQSSGTSLLLATLVFVTVFFGLRAIVDRLLQRRRRERGFTLRLLEVLLRVLVTIAALAAMLVVPYARNDWLLLAVCLVFLLGAGWVVVRMLPQFFEQIRLVLNVGGVREGERILVDGLPFRIQALRFYTRLENPDLQGGVLRVPLQFLVGKRSRASGPDEPWFPTRSGDVVLLADGTFGPVRTQTPEVVVVEHWGTPRSVPTGEFLRLLPRNLSRGFVVDATLVLGRTHEAAATATVCRTLANDLRQALAAMLPAEQLRDVAVAFQSTSANGFELLATATCAGAAAGQFFVLRRRMHEVFVEACEQHGWRLPVPVLVAPAN